MRKSFFQLTETAADDEKIESLVRRGLVRRDGENSVWDDVLDLFGQNRAEAAALFGVKPEAISRGMGRLRKTLSTVRDQVGIDNKKRTRGNMIHTGI